jgi:autotransporter-associated beta strand protein
MPTSLGFVAPATTSPATSATGDVRGTIQLSTGGKLATGRNIVSGSARYGSLLDSSYLHFDGGTLQTLTNITSFLNGLTTVDIDANGAIIDDGGFVVSIPTPLSDAGGGFLTKQGSGGLYLDGNNTYAGPTTNAAGTLGGSGSFTGDLIVNSGATLAPGDAGTNTGTLTVGGNLSLNGNVSVKVNTLLAQSNDVVAVTGTLNNTGSGLVVVSNAGPTLVVGDKFTLFSQPLAGGGALTVSGGGATWTNNLAVDGSISVLTVTPLVNTNTFTLGTVVTPTSIQLSWPPDRLGWKLQTQTNALSTGLGTNWVVWPGSATVTNLTIPINPANPSVFIRMTYP